MSRHTGPQKAQDVVLGKVTLGETLVTRGLWEYMKREKSLLREKLKAFGTYSTSSKLGNIYEAFSVECLANLLRDKALAMLVSKKYLTKILAIYKEPIQLVHTGNFGLVQEMADVLTMLMWLEDVEAVF
ncbi:hypothetical protein GOP47_0001278 [Adiantum capillus-veneris]|uniref:Uncharacterized protein n=1 Tax=Adiantum capillus-veneris TaxID=13818 RepID=A0A9D4ZQK6_ADICA|nr:hypothetical protein GOP47_0001278 [Adiantum capillus-veneris]